MIPFTIESYVAWKQPDILKLIWLLWPPVEEEFTPEQKKLDKLMRQPPKLGRASALREEVN